MKIFKIAYQWHEGEYSEVLIGKDVSSEEFEKDIIKAKEFAESLIGKEIQEGEYLGKGYRVYCLPEYYEQIIWFLKKKLKYIEYEYNKDVKYMVDDFSDKKIQIIKMQKKIDQIKII